MPAVVLGFIPSLSEHVEGSEARMGAKYGASR